MVDDNLDTNEIDSRSKKVKKSKKTVTMKVADKKCSKNVEHIYSKNLDCSKIISCSKNVEHRCSKNLNSNEIKSYSKKVNKVKKTVTMTAAVKSCLKIVSCSKNVEDSCSKNIGDKKNSMKVS